jgi:tryptophan halogenase
MPGPTPQATPVTQAATRRPLERVVIVGGGTAGWMAAAYLNRYLTRLKAKVVLVESPTLGTIGVGEATVPSLVQFIRLMNLDENEFMRRCSATFKLAIRFDGWHRPDTTYWHPFGISARLDGLDLFHFWLKRRLDAAESLAYSDYSAQVQLCTGEKAPRPANGATPITDAGAYAYHLDASAFGEYLKGIATSEGVQHLFGDVQDVVLDPHGNIASLDIGGGRTLAGDLFIDATGFRGRLIEHALGDPWIDWSKYMLCDRAVALPLPRSDSFPPYTLSTALAAGWRWQIPLSSRTGSGYVYSSAHLSADAATQELIARSGLRRARSADPRQLDIRVGRRQNFWLRNCVSLGLASGFVEPLESTGIHLIQKAVILLVEYLPDRDFNDALRRAYNARMAAVYDEVRDFIVLHYLLAGRDEPFWRDARNVPLPDSLRESLAIYEESGRIESGRIEDVRLRLFFEPSYFAILTGNAKLPRRPIAEADCANMAELGRVLARVRASNGELAGRMPSHKAVLAELHRLSFE